MKKTISIFFSGTGFSINDSTYLAASLYNKTQENEQQIKMGFDGCGVHSPFLGTIFGSGLDEQCDEAIQRITQEIAAGHEITLNVYGHSRGAIGAIMLAQQLSLVDPNKLSINMALLDPVPGNLITTSTLDPLNISLANKTMDLTHCKPLKKVLALYPHIPLPAIACHAPLFVSYPEGIELEEDIIGGCHAQAEHIGDSASIIAESRVEEFFVKNETKIKTSSDYSDNEKLKQFYIRTYEYSLNKLNATNAPMTRDAHSARDVYINTKMGAHYFNEHHKRLAGGAKDAIVALTLEHSDGLFSRLTRAFKAYPVAEQILKWSFLSISIASILFFTGGLAAIPMIAAVVAKLGALSILAAAPIVGGALATLWYCAFKPALLWAANKFFYPKYSIRDIPVISPENAKGTTGTLLDKLSDDAAPVPKLQGAQSTKAPYHGGSLFNPASLDQAPLKTSLPSTFVAP